MQRDAGDIIDRYSIAILKAKRIGLSENKEEENLYHRGFKALGNDNQEVDFLDILIGINGHIWDLESAVRKGALDNNPYEVGQRAIQIRKLNRIRVSVKNVVNALRGEGARDIKKNHLSE